MKQQQFQRQMQDADNNGVPDIYEPAGFKKSGKNNEAKYAAKIQDVLFKEQEKMPLIAINAIQNSINTFYEGVNNGTLKTQKDIQSHFQVTENYLSKAATYETGKAPNFSVDKEGNAVLSIGENSYPIPKDLKKANIEMVNNKDFLVLSYAEVLEAANPKDKQEMLEAAKNLGLHVSTEKDGDINVMAGYKTAHIKNPKTDLPTH